MSNEQKEIKRKLYKLYWKITSFSVRLICMMYLAIAGVAFYFYEMPADAAFHMAGATFVYLSLHKELHNDW